MPLMLLAPHRGIDSAGHLLVKLRRDEELLLFWGLVGGAARTVKGFAHVWPVRWRP